MRFALTVGTKVEQEISGIMLNASAIGWGPGPFVEGEQDDSNHPPKPTAIVEWSVPNKCWMVLIRAIKDGEEQEFAIAIDI